jgi:outer membrane protein TolC
MLFEARQMAQLARQQQTLASQLVDTAAARYASARGAQAEVLRAEVEAARAVATIGKADADLRAAEAMFNASLGRAIDASLPELGEPVDDAEPADAATLRGEALRSRPELRAGQAEIARAGADILAMKSMYLPMGMLRIGRASTMAEGPGTMAMIGLSLPIWTGRLRAGVAEAEAMEQMAQADFEAMRRMVEAETVAAREAVIGAHQQYLALRDDILTRARMALAPAQAPYASGQGSMTALIETLQALWMAQTDLVMSRSQLALAWARLLRATGATTGESP